MKVAATGWLTVGLAPISTTTSARITSITGLLTAPEPMPSSSATTDEAWHSRVQWSTLLLPKPVRTSFWNRYASSLLPLAEPKPASALRPCVSRISRRRPPAKSNASSQLASRNTSITRSGSITKSPDFGGASLRRISGLVRRCGWCA